MCLEQYAILVSPDQIANILITGGLQISAYVFFLFSLLMAYAGLPVLTLTAPTLLAWQDGDSLIQHTPVSAIRFATVSKPAVSSWLSPAALRTMGELFFSLGWSRITIRFSCAATIL